MSKLYNRVKRAGGGPGLYANIAAKKKRIAAGSGEKMRKKVLKVHPLQLTLKEQHKQRGRNGKTMSKR